MRDISYLMMYKNDQNEIHTVWVNLMPDSAWLQHQNLPYSGYIDLKSWDGKRIKFEYIRGNSSVNTTKRAANASEPIEPVVPDPMNCITVNNRCKGVNYYPQCFPSCDMCWLCTTTYCSMQPPPEALPPIKPEAPQIGENGGPADARGSGFPSSKSFIPKNCSSDPNFIPLLMPSPKVWIKLCNATILLK